MIICHHCLGVEAECGVVYFTTIMDRVVISDGGLLKDVTKLPFGVRGTYVAEWINLGTLVSAGESFACGGEGGREENWILIPLCWPLSGFLLEEMVCYGFWSWITTSIGKSVFL